MLRCTHGRNTAHHEIDCEDAVGQFMFKSEAAAYASRCASDTALRVVAVYSLANSLGVFDFLTSAILTVLTEEEEEERD